jgi:hypothetical protein
LSQVLLLHFVHVHTPSHSPSELQVVSAHRDVYGAAAAAVAALLDVTATQLPFDSLKPTRFAKVLPNHQPSNKSTLYGIQLTLSKFEYEGALNPKFTEGRFSLLVKDILLF